MATEIKKYLDLAVGLPQLVDEVQAADAKVLDAAKAHAEGLAPNYDAAGSANQAKLDAIADADAKFTTVNENIAKKADTTVLEAEVTRATGKEAELLAAIEATDAIADKNAEDIATINDAENGILAQAKADSKAKADAVQANVDALAVKVGDLPEGTTAKDVVDYVNIKTAGIATDTALGELQSQLDGVQETVQEIQSDYLVEADKTELSTAISDEVARADAAEKANAAAIKAISDDYLKAADKEELQGNIDVVSGAVERLTNGVSAEEVDGVNDLIQYVKDHGTEVTGMKADIKANADAIAEEIARATGKENEIVAAVATKAEQSVLDQAVATLQGEDTAIKGRLDALELQLGDGEGSVVDMIADAKQEAINAAAGDATTKVNKALEDAKKYADDEDAKIEARVEALEEDTHTHANKDLLDTYTQTEANLADAVAKKHAHANAGVLDGITAEKVTAWDAAEANAKDFAQGLANATNADVEALEGRMNTVEGAVATKAESSVVSTLAERVTTNEALSAENKSRLDSFVAISAAEVSALFA